MRSEGLSEEENAQFDSVKSSLGYGLLLDAYAEDLSAPTDAEVQAAVDASIPKIAPLFWAFRLMVACGFFMLLVFALAFFYSTRHGQEKPRWLLKLALFSLPLPWIASEAGWFVAEYGRQPWAIAEILPIHTAVSNLAVSDVVISLIAVTVFYTVMFIIGLSLMIKFARKGPGVIAPAASAERLQGVES